MKARNLLQRLVGLVGFTFSVITRVIWPYFADMAYTDGDSKRDTANVTLLQRRVSRCLFLNLSVLLEPVFRIKVTKILTAHIGNPLSDFDKTRAELNRLMFSRNQVARSLVPADHVVRCLGAAGFFSLASHPNLQSCFSRTPSLKNLILRVSFLKKFGTLGGRLLTQISSLKLLPDSSLDEFRSALTSRRHPPEPASEVLIVGPGATTFPTNYAKFDEVWWLLTPSTDCNRVAAQMARVENNWLVFNNVAAELACGPSSSQFEELLKLAQGVVSHSQWEKQFTDMALPTRNFHSPLSEGFLSGSPNLLPRAIGLAMLRMARSTVIGADLYTGERLYWRESQHAKPGSNQSAHLHPFFTCISLSGHNPLSNFNAVKLAVSAGFIVGSREFLKVTSMSSTSYLERIDYSVGKVRK